jgi:hypothetical protein
VLDAMREGAQVPTAAVVDEQIADIKALEVRE